MNIPRIHFKKEQLYQLIIAIAIILTVVAAIYAIINGRHYFNRRSLRQLQGEITSYGIWSPFIIFFLIFINILIPPLPIPVPFVEIAAGVIFGFWPGVIIVWISQVLSSIATYIFSKHIGKLFLRNLMRSNFLNFFRQFIEKRGAFAIFVIRATMSAPFSVSYLAGFMQVGLLGFTGAIMLGAIPETVLFVYLGTLIQHTRIRLWYIFTFLVILSILPFILLLISKLLPKRGNKK